MKKTLLCLTLIPLFVLNGCKNEQKIAPNNQHETSDVDHLQAQGIISRSLPEIAAALSAGKINSEQLVNLYLQRIAQIDNSGPKLQAVLSINPDAIKIAQQLDQLRLEGKIKGPLHGVPVLLKDNIESKDPIPTTAGAMALKNNYTFRDSPLVAGLRAQGAIILGKTNLSQWANFRSESSMSGWSVLGGQVRNPHMLDRNPCGSSSGSGAASAASLAAGSIGTETNGSIICPSNANGLVGFKPSVGLISQQYIVPISSSQDTAGPMTKTVTGAAMLMDAMVTPEANMHFAKQLSPQALKGVKVGVLQFAKGDNQAIIDLFLRAQIDLSKAGALLVDIEERPDTPPAYYAMAYDLLKYEFKHGINEYLASTPEHKVAPRSLEQLIAYNQQHASTELALFDQSIFIAAQAMDSLSSQLYKDSVTLVQQVSRNNIDTLLASYDVDVLIAPSGTLAPRVDPINGDVWPNNWPGYGGAAAHAGYPHATVPMGGVNAIPVGLSFIGSKHQDPQVLSYAFAYEQHSNRRLSPEYLANAEALPAIKQAMNPAK